MIYQKRYEMLCEEMATARRTTWTEAGGTDMTTRVRPEQQSKPPREVSVTVRRIAGAVEVNVVSA